MPREIIQPIRGARAAGTGDALQVVQGSGARAVATTAGATSTSAVALPAGTELAEVRCIGGDAWIRFGASDVAAAAAGADSILFPAGEKLMIIPGFGGTVSTHFTVIRAGATDVAVQIERVDANAI